MNNKDEKQTVDELVAYLGNCAVVGGQITSDELRYYIEEYSNAIYPPGIDPI